MHRSAFPGAGQSLPVQMTSRHCYETVRSQADIRPLAGPAHRADASPRCSAGRTARSPGRTPQPSLRPTHELSQVRSLKNYSPEGDGSRCPAAACHPSWFALVGLLRRVRPAAPATGPPASAATATVGPSARVHSMGSTSQLLGRLLLLAATLPCESRAMHPEGQSTLGHGPADLALSPACTGPGSSASSHGNAVRHRRRTRPALERAPPSVGDRGAAATLLAACLSPLGPTAVTKPFRVGMPPSCSYTSGGAPP